MRWNKKDNLRWIEWMNQMNGEMKEMKETTNEWMNEWMKLNEIEKHEFK